MAANLIRQNESFLRQLSQDPSTPEEVSSRISRYVDDQDWFPHLYPDLAVTDSEHLNSAKSVPPAELEPYDTPSSVEASRHGQGLASDSDEMQQDDLDEILLHLSMDDNGKVRLWPVGRVCDREDGDRAICSSFRTASHSSCHISGQRRCYTRGYPSRSSICTARHMLVGKHNELDPGRNHGHRDLTTRARLMISSFWE